MSARGKCEPYRHWFRPGWSFWKRAISLRSGDDCRSSENSHVAVEARIPGSRYRERNAWQLAAIFEKSLARLKRESPSLQTGLQYLTNKPQLFADHVSLFERMF